MQVHDNGEYINIDKYDCLSQLFINSFHFNYNYLFRESLTFRLPALSPQFSMDESDTSKGGSVNNPCKLFLSCFASSFVEVEIQLI